MKIIDDIRSIFKLGENKSIKYNIHDYRNIAKKILNKTNDYSYLSDNQLFSIAKLQKDKTLNIIDIYSLIYEVVYRILKLKTFDEQLVAACAINDGKIAQMQTGEGKTLAAVYPAILNALNNKSVHILTANEYLAYRDANWMKKIYNVFDLKVSSINQKMNRNQKRKAYRSDIVYSSVNEIGFDYLRDNLVQNKFDMVQRKFDFVIIDEIDSILIDEARIPLIIAGKNKRSKFNKNNIADLVKQLDFDLDIKTDQFRRNAFLTEHGINTIEKKLNIQNLFDSDNHDLLTMINQAIHAEFLLIKDKDYIIKNGRIEVIDELKSRIADKQRFPDGLHNALEAKEKLLYSRSGKILGMLTIQDLIQRYLKISGMTATAEDSAYEFKKNYELSVVAIPPHKPCIRIDQPDSIFTHKKAKFNAIIKEIISVHKTSRPILVGTSSISESEQIADILKEKNIKCNVLNAKNDEMEAEIIADAGKKNAITISTNMAGRGVDIKLGGRNEEHKDEIAKLGGLYVIGTNRHDSVRIDYQLRGRAARQGDPGSSRFFVSLEDDLIIKYERNKQILNKYKTLKEDSISNKRLNKEIDWAQRLVNAQNISIKHDLEKYTYVMKRQSIAFYKKRRRILLGKYNSLFFKIMKKKVNHFIRLHSQKKIDELERIILLSCLDNAWALHLKNISDLQENIQASSRIVGEPVSSIWGGYGEKSIDRYNKLVYDSYNQIIKNAKTKAIRIFQKINIQKPFEKIIKSNNLIPKSTWTYLVTSDNERDMMKGKFAILYALLG